MRQPADQRSSSGSGAEDVADQRPGPARRRHRRWPLTVAVLVGVLCVVGSIETIVDSSLTAVALAGTVAGVVFGLVGLRYVPPMDEKTVWFGLAWADDLRNRQPARTALVWRILPGLLLLFGGGAAYFLLFPLLEPFPTCFFYGALAVLAPATLVQWCYPATLVGRP